MFAPEHRRGGSIQLEGDVPRGGALSAVLKRLARSTSAGEDAALTPLTCSVRRSSVALLRSFGERCDVLSRLRGHGRRVASAGGLRVKQVMPPENERAAAAFVEMTDNSTVPALGQKACRR
ncbi:hypothetical protein EYF80_027552 [Liparis tanakae]|uniref:Uncharacterized protein n=1 Tax=Liparis tanakae TaxID=230148 RepID=A0A4Z2HBL4_9TELE|nr:hypothetical protein EYF80_027552 [Liparis tanakae]